MYSSDLGYGPLVSPDQSSPTRLFATLSGALLVIGGTVGFFHSSDFGTPGDVHVAFGELAVNGWINTLHIVAGALGLLAAGFAARAYSLFAAILFGALAIWGIALGGDEAILDRFPADGTENLFHAVLAALGLAAWLAERPPRKPREKGERKPRDTKEGKPAEDERDRKPGEKDETEEAAKDAGEDRSQPSESGDDSASPAGEPRRRRARRSQRRRRPPRPPA